MKSLSAKFFWLGTIKETKIGILKRFMNIYVCNKNMLVHKLSYFCISIMHLKLESRETKKNE
jgi:hypothetical protein